MVRTAFLVGLVVFGSLALAQRVIVYDDSQEPACGGKSRLARVSGSSPLAYADPRYDVTHYLLNLRLETSPALIVGQVTMTAACVAETLSTCLIDLSAGMAVDSVLCNGIRTTVVPYPAGFEAALDRVYRAGERFSITTWYRGIPEPSGFGSFIFSSYGSSPWVWSLSQPYGARDWWPCKDHQGDKADSVEVRVTVAAGLKVGSNGRLVSVTANGDGTSTHRWIELYPIATYLVSVAVSDYATFSDWYRYSATDSMEILNYVLPVSLETARAELRKTVDMLGIFEQLFGRYPFITEKYGHSEFGIGGAMEHQTMTSTTTFNEFTIAHELAHQWFGDLITCASWRDLWLNEGFASYSEALYREQRYGREDYHAAMDAFLPSALNAQGTLYLEDTSSVASMFRFPRVYAKGASVLHMLRWVLGDSLFFQALRTYAADPRYRYGVATTSDFQNVCETVSGRSLETFFQQWVFGERYPRYTISWSAVGEPGGTVNQVQLDQTTGTDNPLFFEMPVALRLRGDGWDTTVTVQHRASGQVFEIRTRNRPTSVELDPENWILKQILDPGTGLPGTFGLDQNYPNPFNPATAITIHVPHRSQATLRVYNVLGEEVATILNETVEPGIRTVTWDGTDAHGTRVASGAYFYRLEAAGASLTRSMMVLR